MPPVAVRLRRDFKTVLMLIRAHALLHQATRQKDEAGRIIATIEDYAAVRELVADLVAAGVEATVRPEVRETVAAVADLIREGASRGSAVGPARLVSSWTSRRSPAVWQMPLIADTCATLRTERDGRHGSSSATRCPTNWTSCLRPSGCTVARLLGG